MYYTHSIKCFINILNKNILRVRLFVLNTSFDNFNN